MHYLRLAVSGERVERLMLLQLETAEERNWCYVT